MILGILGIIFRVFPCVFVKIFNIFLRFSYKNDSFLDFFDIKRHFMVGGVHKYSKGEKIVDPGGGGYIRWVLEIFLKNFW